MHSKTLVASPAKPTYVPVIIGGIACLISVLIFSLFRTGSLFIYLGYLCTPFVPIAGLAIARTTDIKGRTNIKFDIAKSNQVLKICGIIALIGFLIAIAIMYEIAMRHSQV